MKYNPFKFAALFLLLVFLVSWLYTEAGLVALWFCGLGFFIRPLSRCNDR